METRNELVLSETKIIAVSALTLKQFMAAKNHEKFDFFSKCFIVFIRNLFIVEKPVNFDMLMKFL